MKRGATARCRLFARSRTNCPDSPTSSRPRPVPFRSGAIARACQLSCPVNSIGELRLSCTSSKQATEVLGCACLDGCLDLLMCVVSITTLLACMLPRSTCWCVLIGWCFSFFGCFSALRLHVSHFKSPSQHLACMLACISLLECCVWCER